jgi:hypothetical protein
MLDIGRFDHGYPFDRDARRRMERRDFHCYELAYIVKEREREREMEDKKREKRSKNKSNFCLHSSRIEIMVASETFLLSFSFRNDCLEM